MRRPDPGWPLLKVHTAGCGRPRLADVLVEDDGVSPAQSPGEVSPPTSETRETYARFLSRITLPRSLYPVVQSPATLFGYLHNIGE